MMRATLTNRDEFLSSWVSLELNALSGGYNREYAGYSIFLQNMADKINREFDTSTWRVTTPWEYITVIRQKNRGTYRQSSSLQLRRTG
ncbi:MAG: hypothetical protein R2744_08780 [Bacteroidales bacterium]